MLSVGAVFQVGAGCGGAFNLSKNCRLNCHCVGSTPLSQITCTRCFPPTHQKPATYCNPRFCENRYTMWSLSGIWCGCIFAVMTHMSMSRRANYRSDTWHWYLYWCIPHHFPRGQLFCNLVDSNTWYKLVIELRYTCHRLQTSFYCYYSCIISPPDFVLRHLSSYQL